MHLSHRLCIHNRRSCSGTSPFHTSDSLVCARKAANPSSSLHTRRSVKSIWVKANEIRINKLVAIVISCSKNLDFDHHDCDLFDYTCEIFWLQVTTEQQAVTTTDCKIENCKASYPFGHVVHSLFPFVSVYQPEGQYWHVTMLSVSIASICFGLRLKVGKPTYNFKLS